ncbi:hypothetical protein IU501_17435 [Nocardia otitidiscaviarum]|uniref:hypothetical protein n=1 Tax=Nocardia otitidiscaviarum TaxID=1823 RepID=UPI000AAFBDA5|nr:hypothetical protein [Nocardia otitidiscaviarum]MBF6134780.1 hypothetical protein [Nocardia otitidiscaviarum]MBF6485594.1 hypothetical protein [Nocardia otitidiscaviarum]
MITYWLPFVIGTATGGIMTWLIPTLTARTTPRPAHGRTVAAIAARLERERRTERHAASARQATIVGSSA